jgi:hypothetical protein
MGIVRGRKHTFFFMQPQPLSIIKNAIIMLRNGSGEEKFSHEDEAHILWEAYKDSWELLNSPIYILISVSFSLLFQT